MSNSKVFIKGTMLLSIAGIITRILSMFFRIPLIYLTGDEGLGYYQAFYPTFMIFTAIAITGMPQTISKLISEKIEAKEEGEAYAYFKTALILLMVFGVVVTLFFFIGGNWLISIAGWERETIYVIYGIGISTVFVCVGGAIKGFFQGRQIMIPTATSQIIEAFIKVIFGLGLTYVLLQKGMDIHIAIFGAAIGTSLGFILSSLYLIIVFLKTKRRENIILKHYNYNFKALGKKLVLLAIPITIGASGYSIMTSIDTLTLYNGLEIAGIGEQANTINGQISKSFSIINVPLTFAVALMVSTVPAIAQAKEKNNIKELKDSIQTSLRFSLLLAFPSAIGLGLLSKPVMQLIYRDNYLGYEYLRLYSICLFFIIIGQALASILHGLGYYMKPVWHILAGAIIKLILNFLLISSPLLGQGALIGSIGFYMVFTLLNYMALKKVIKDKVYEVNNFIKIFISAIIMGTIVVITYYTMISIIGRDVATILSIGIGGMVYIILLFLTKSVQEEDLYALPKHQSIIKTLKKIRLI
ncbi:stage V sporulation protein B [Natranaerovirga hydrolytica]|uniref:Stage V sporulation protein B n=1 Tax=Natranaerovirga hydrolytica TaxID=680378 RepID=A0A4R1MZQ3_9FIRM|nr:polysaccharide biosynthesis protein [Natranaerovirga hydrolytica]TCK98827.1 stage V sporulation protein B [Natranaerovirga hydrolytica]